jgi:tetratricopeptide (TPR) repeat protein/type II secretory pathway predicted ATPase ExeA
MILHVGTVRPSVPPVRSGNRHGPAPGAQNRAGAMDGSRRALGSPAEIASGRGQSPGSPPEAPRQVTCPRGRGRLLACNPAPNWTPVRRSVIDVVGCMRAGTLIKRPIIDGLILGRVLGRGGFAEIYQAHSGERQVAVKIAREHGDSHVQREAEILRVLGPRLRAELAAIAALVRDGVTGDGRRFVCLELVDGESLADVFTRQGAQAPAAIAGPFAALCHSMTSIHRAGVVHRDVKPGNVIFRADGSAAIIDFGLARLIGEPGGDDGDDGDGASLDATRSGERRGTALYMAPEQWLGRGPFDQRTDVYALGVILYEWLTGNPPFSGSAAEIRHGHVAMRRPRPSERTPLPPAVDEVVLRSLASDPAERFALASDLARAFRDAVPAAPAPPGLEQRTEREESVALLGLRTQGHAVALAELAAEHGAVIAVAAQERCVLAFPFAPSVSAGVRMAMATAELCARRLARTSYRVVHVARLGVRRRGHRLRLWGEPLDRLDAWLDASLDAWRGGAGRGAAAGPVLLTAAAASHLEGARPAGGHERGDGLGDGVDDGLRDGAPTGAGGDGPIEPSAVHVLPPVDPASLALRGRDQLVARLLAELQAILARSSGMVLLAGETGMGKTRVLHAVARELRMRGGCRVLYLRGASPADRDAGELPAALMASLAPGAEGPRLHGHETDAPDAARRALAHELAHALQRTAHAMPLVVLLDDAHQADHATLDALRQAATATEREPGGLAVLAAADPSLLTLRPDWRQVLPPRHLHELGPLDPDSARALLRDLLHPVEHAPADALERLLAFSGGVPLHLVELARIMRESGAIRQRPGHHSYFLAADQILAGTSGRIHEHLAQRTLLPMPAELAGLAEICAILTDSFTRDDVRGVQRCLDAIDPGNLATALDASVGLERLVHRGLLAHQAGGEPGVRSYRVRNALIARGIEARIEAGARRALHRAALAHWQGVDGCPRHRLAHHASRAGAAELALSLHLDLADEARRRHRLVDAETHYTAAIEHAAARSEGWARALAGRGRIRYRLLRLDDALDDLREAGGFFAGRGDERQRIALLLEQAKVLDWRQEYSLAAAISREAAPAARALGDAWLVAESELAVGRAHFRQNQFERGVACLAAAASWARANGAEETLIIALLVLAPMLVYVGRLDEAAAAYEEVIRACQEAGDDFHLATAYLNRITLWVELAGASHDGGDGIARIVDDMERCIALGNALGNAQFEQIATMNLAEFLYWNGSFDRALALAERARELQMKLYSSYGNAALLLARIACALGDPGARGHVAWIARSSSLEDMPPVERDLLRMVCLACDALEGEPVSGDAWQALARAAEEHAPLCEHVEVLITASEIFWRGGRSGEARDWLERAARAAGQSSLWSRRLGLLRDRLSG